MLNQRIVACVCGGIVGAGLSAGAWAASPGDGQVTGAPAAAAQSASGETIATGTELSGGSAPGAAATIPAQESATRASLTTWIWLVGVDGTIGARDLTTDVSADFGDVLEASDSVFAFSGRLEVGSGAFGAFFDGMYAKLGVDDVSGPPDLGNVDIVNEMVLMDFGLSYRVGTWEPSGAAARNVHDLTLDLYAGGRYTDLKLELDPAMAAERSDSQSWIDPIVGAKVVLPIGEDWHLAMNGDIGGFGAGSDFTWSTTGVAGYDFSMLGCPTTAYFGYRAIGQDYTDQDGPLRFSWDVVQHGPVVGLTLRF